MKNVTIGCIQTVSGGVATPEYVDRILAKANPAIELAVLPELCNVPYFPLEENSHDAQHAVRIDGPEILAFANVALKNRCYLMTGIFLAAQDRRYNAAILLGPDGRIVAGRASDGRKASVFNKVHLCDVRLPGVVFCESGYFEPGSDYVVWDLPFGRVGVLICYDRHFPEAWIALRDMGAELICVCTTSPVNAAPYFVAEMQGMAVQQSVFAAVANRVGRQKLRTSGLETEFLGSSMIAGPFGEIISVAPERENVELVSATVDGSAIERIRAGHMFHEHRRTDTYIALKQTEWASER
jgi:predicted amidohydrolase